MNVLVEGPKWMGQWSEIVVDAFRNLGHSTHMHYHNCKPWGYRLGRIIPGRSEPLATFSNRQLLRLAGEERVDLLFSIQGKLDAATVRLLRQRNPGMKVVYWFGDILFDRARQRVEEVYPLVDRLLLSYHGDYLEMSCHLGSNVHYFPFGVSPRFHRLPSDCARDRKRFATDVAFVGTHYPERDELLRDLQRRSPVKLDVWGRSWRRSDSLHSRGRLTMAETLKVHHYAKIALNIHHKQTRDGFNMKFFEIPAAGGFQICDWQPEIERLQLNSMVTTFRDKDELHEKIAYFLPREELRREMSLRFQRYLWENFRYDVRLGQLIENLGSQG